MFLHTGFLKEKPERNQKGFSPVAFVACNIFTGAIWLYNKSMAQGINRIVSEFRNVFLDFSMKYSTTGYDTPSPC